MSAVFLAVLTAQVASPAANLPRRPNVVVIMTDDMGYSDIGCYGGEIATPHLDALAAGGLRFTQFYNTGRCCPTRASLLTGLYPHQAGVGHMVDSQGTGPGYVGNLNDHCVTLAEVLKPAGYGTCMTGKWHVCKNVAPEGPKHTWPLARGFEKFYGTIAGGGNYYDPSTLTRGNTPISPYADAEYQPERYYYTDAISDHAVRFLKEHDAATPEAPVFLYVAYTAAHWPMHAFEEDIARQAGRYDGGYEPVRAARFERMQELGLLDPNWELSERAGDWGRVKEKAWEARCMEVYAAMVARMDTGVGNIVAELKRTGRLDNTLILYLQDNGGCAEGIGRTGNPGHPDIPRPAAPTLTPMTAETLLPPGSRPSQTRDGYPVRMGKNVMPGPEDTYIGYGENWANVSNTPFRLYKHFVHEGGIATPLIAHWPAGITRRGELENTPAHLIDVMATCVDLAQAPYPARRDGTPVTPPEGVSLAPLFRGDVAGDAAPYADRPLFWEHEGNRAVRVGDRKLVARGAKGRWELYDLSADRTEQHDLSAQRLDETAALAARWQAWAKRADVLPLRGR